MRGTTLEGEAAVATGREPAAIQESKAHRRWRLLEDRWTRYLMAAGGVGVIITILLIFVYLLYVVLPLFARASIQPQASYPVPGGPAETLWLGTEEYAEIGLRLSDDGRAVFFKTRDGQVISDERLALPEEARITAYAAGDPHAATLSVGLSNGTALVFRHRYSVSFPNDVRTLTPEITYPLGPAPVAVDPEGHALTHLAVQSQDRQTTLAAVTEDGRLLVANFAATRSLLEEGETITRQAATIPGDTGPITHLALGLLQRELYTAGRDGSIHYYDITKKTAPSLVDKVGAVGHGQTVTAMQFLSGGISLLVGDSAGGITQWFAVRDDRNSYNLSRVRSFSAQTHPITRIAPEFFRKGFAAVDESGTLGLYHATAERTLLVQRIIESPASPVEAVAMSPRADALLVEDGAGRLAGRLHFFRIHNEHPEVSWHSLWGQVWYESRERPEYLWQSSAATGDFEPKFSLSPLTLGTLKAAVYAMLFAVPMAIMGAVYTGYFMSAGMRQIVKPSIEVMGALPTVILGFLAGLWLAPFVEANLAGVFALPIVVPAAVLIAAYLWSLLPEALCRRVPEGSEAALLLPVVAAAIFTALAAGEWLEATLFAGDMPAWLTRELGIPFDQRNSLVVGIAMGFAVIPPIFTISEDAIFSVPRHLTLGSLALGATSWQTLTRVVILTASPAIFSAVMIGLGRAVGETMIVLMATGNTPIMDWNPFQGFRALSANVAVEMPESEVNSTHYRVLFLAALVLFLATFLFNTVAEVFRQRLRERYSNL
ncbi:MAG: phosphate ABC transporter permease [Gammaproteobacteria bacterium]